MKLNFLTWTNKVNLYSFSTFKSKNKKNIIISDRIPSSSRGVEVERIGGETIGEAIRQKESSRSCGNEVPRTNRRFRETRIRRGNRTQRDGKTKQTKVKY